MLRNDFLEVVETFKTFQGEGKSLGKIAVFCRLRRCNLQCIAVRNGRHVPRIMTAGGPNKRITEVRVGEVLLTIDESSGKMVETTVREVLRRTVPSYYELKIEGVPTLYSTEEHPFLTARGWVLARNLRVGDEIYHVSAREKSSHSKKGSRNPMRRSEVAARSAANTDYAKVGQKTSTTRLRKFASGELRSSAEVLKERDPEKYARLQEESSKRMLGDKNPRRNPKYEEKYLGTALKHRIPSKIERYVIKVIDELGLPIRYTGNGGFWVGKTGEHTYLCPDFKVDGEKKVIEVFDSRYTWDRPADYLTSRPAAYRDRGYECLMLDFYSVRPERTHSVEQLGGLLRAFLSNGRRVLATKRFGPERKKYPYQEPKAVPVYNFHCEPHNSYIVDGLVVHNCNWEGGNICDAYYTWKKGDPTYETGYRRWTAKETAEKLVQLAGENTEIFVISGGEPLLWQRQLVQLTELLPFPVEIETNGTIAPRLLRSWKDVSFNVSPKLGSSGNGGLQRIVPSALIQFSQLAREDRAVFKFVVTKDRWEQDFQEIADLEDLYRLKPIYVMPEGVTSEEINAGLKLIAGPALQRGWRLTTRLHIYVWGNERGR